ncbi:MAG: D-alanine--D-alanine ligase [Nitrospinae bacterium CG11_big_fil_rev_8_21_14_0_20_56_8]|nr:MAG: D-alanine--D-alanine ligase [Nitrospinae bacterium CG11_big_fil_rev_8_21_14_0_20_56_8]
MKGKKIGVLMGGLSPEREVSLTTGRAVVDALLRKDLDCIPIDVTRNVARQVVESGISLAFVALHGTFGEDGTIQGILEYARIPYTGSGVLGSAIAYDKVISKEIFKVNGIPTADYVVYYKKNPSGTRKPDLPVVVKPSNQGSSIGVTIVREEKDWAGALELAFTYSDEVLVEKFIEGKLLAIGMKGEEPMPIVNIRPKSGFYDYEAKYTKGKTDYFCPADLTDKEVSRCHETAVEVFRVLKGRGVPRVDVILGTDGVPYVLEMNTIPGMTATSLLPMAARQMGMEFDDLVIEILNSARLDYEA